MKKSTSHHIALSKIKKSCDDVARILKAIAHPQRLTILCILMNGEKSVSEVMKNCDISQSQISQFLIRMRLEGLITCRKDGRNQYYSVADQRLLQLMRVLQSEYCH